MDNKTSAIPSCLSALFFSSVLVLGFAFLGNAHANQLPQPGQGYNKTTIQLAHGGPRHRHHRHGYYRPRGYIYFGPGYYRAPRVYWTGWRGYYRHGRKCVQRCLINRYTGQTIRCHRRCY